MKEKIQALINEAKEKVEAVKELAEINELKVSYLGKTGAITNLLKGMKDVPQEQRPEVGKYVNQARDLISEIIANKLQALEQKALENKMMKEKIDITIDEVDANRGSLHPCTLVINEILDIFNGLGFVVGNGTEIELDKFNF